MNEERDLRRWHFDWWLQFHYEMQRSLWNALFLQGIKNHDEDIRGRIIGNREVAKVYELELGAARSAYIELCEAANAERYQGPFQVE